MPGVSDFNNQASSVHHHNQQSNIKFGSFAPASSNYNYYHFSGGSGANSNSYIRKVVDKRNMQPPIANGAGYNPNGLSSYTATVYDYGTTANDEDDRKIFKKIELSTKKSKVVVKAEMNESTGAHVGHLAEAKAEMDESKGVQVGHLEETSENLVVNQSRKRKASSSTHQDKIFTQKEMIKSRGRCLVELDSYYTSHYDLQDFLTSQKRPKNDKDMRLGIGAENSRHFRMPDEAIQFVRGGTFDANDCLKFDPPPNFFYRKSKALQDLDWN